jgi:hypothetical protein
MRKLLVLLAVPALLGASWLHSHQPTPLTAEEQAVIAAVAAASMRGHVSFLASDLLEGRATPSRGLDIAAAYIAAQFRRIGLEPAGGDDYFQHAKYGLVKPGVKGFELTLDIDGERIAVPAANAIAVSNAGQTLTGVEIVKIDPAVSDPEKVTAGMVRGKAVFIAAGARTPEQFRAASVLRGRLKEYGAVLSLSTAGMFRASGRLTNLEDPPPLATLLINHEGARKALDGLKPGMKATLTATLPAALKEPVQLKNVVSLLRGSDPALRDSYILVSAHYDHIGMLPEGSGDRINNGANDDASGVACMLETAAAIARLPQRPKRSMVFVAYFGEELGLFGSRYYAAHPAFPLARTIGDINLEQMGRTDDFLGKQEGILTMTGMGYSTLSEVLAEAATATGLKVRKQDHNSDTFFDRSDNQSLADAGIPAHTVLASYNFADYHRPGDEWQRLDYANMERLNRAVALGVYRLANSSTEPHWNASEAKAAKYLKAWQALHPTH